MRTGSMAFIEVTTTSDSAEVLEGIADALVRKRLAACVQVSGPVRSVYRWRGRIVHVTEWKCTIKTTKSAYRNVEAEILKRHNYSLPQVTAIDIAGGSKDYLGWMGEGVT